MNEAAQNVGFTNADRDRAAIETRVANADAQMARLTAEFRDSPSQRLDRDRAELARLSDDVHFQNALASGHQGAKAQLTAVNARIATAERELTKLTSLDRIEQAFNPPADDSSIVDTKTGDELSRQDLRTLVRDGKEKNTPAPIVQESLLPNSNDPRVIAEARRRLEALVADPEWQARLTRGDRATVEQFDNLSKAARASADEPAWSLPFYGRATA